MPKTTSQLPPTVLVDEARVAARITALGKQIAATYKSENPLFLCLLRGGVPFASQLMFAIVAADPDFHPQMEYMRVKTYGGTRQAHEPEITVTIDQAEINGRTVVIVDDILDTGRTPGAIESYLQTCGAKEVQLIVLVQKQKPRTQWHEATLHGFELPDVWITGMGCDDTATAPEGYRWAPYIGSASQ